MAGHLDLGQVIHAGAAQQAVVPQETAGLDDIDGHAQTGCQAQQSAAILWNIGLKESKAHGGGALLGKIGKLHYTPRPGDFPSSLPRSGAKASWPGCLHSASVCRRGRERAGTSPM